MSLARIVNLGIIQGICRIKCPSEDTHPSILMKAQAEKLSTKHAKQKRKTESKFKHNQNNKNKKYIRMNIFYTQN